MSTSDKTSTLPDFSDSAERFNEEDFARAFVAALVVLEIKSIQPKEPRQRRALNAVWEYLRDQVEKERPEKKDPHWFRTIVRIRNRLNPGQTGAHDHFETALRDLQLSLTESPNPYYEDIEFTVSIPYAGSILENLDPTARMLAQDAARTFYQSLSST